MLNWIDDVCFEMNGYKITLDYAHGGSRRESTAHDFTMMKDRHFLDEYVALQGQNIKRILEIGVYQGGSFVFLDQLLKPEKISAVELSTVPLPALDQYVRENIDRARVHYGTSQDDVSRLKEIIAQDMGGEVDLVVDDASHFYEQTKTTFETVFPMLRPGGVYLIEDWSWSFQAPYQEAANAWFDKNSLANLFIDLAEDMILGPLIADVTISRPMMKIRRANVAAASIFKHHARRGRTLGHL
jgi:predicted O-methyltransferase YrrM